jgi:hypothetical protein
MKPVAVAIEEVRFHIRNVRTRMPFKYGKAQLTATPILHVRMKVTGEGDRSVEGYSADCLPPKWFDKDPSKDFRRNVDDLLLSAQGGASAYQEAGGSPASLFGIWSEAYRKTISRVGAQGLNGLTASFGSSLMERALIDAVCKLAGVGFSEGLRENIFGLKPGDVHPELADISLEQAFRSGPRQEIAVRHTIGLADPLRDSDIPSTERLTDGLPQSLEECVRVYGLRYFKIKVTNELEFDRERLASIAELLEEIAPRDFKVSLDGNESFQTMEDLGSWLEALQADERIRRLFDRTLYIEQPIERSVAFHPKIQQRLSELQRFAPIIIDESDDALGTFKTAAEFGYRGVSVKNCKGVIKGILNKLLVDSFNGRGEGPYLLTGEDLMNVPVVPLQQDLATLSALGLEHVERNGHHYCRGLDHLSREEVEACLKHHPNLYERTEWGARLSIREGKLDVASLSREGLGSVMRPDFESLTPLEQWSFDSLGG